MRNESDDLLRHSSFGFDSSFWFRHSDFVPRAQHFPARYNHSMRAIVTGQVGVDKGPYLQAVQKEAQSKGFDLKVCHVGKMMYEEAPDVPAGRILNLPISRLNTL